MSLRFLGKLKDYPTCKPCGRIGNGKYFEWHLLLTDRLIKPMCLKCAIREYGKKYVSHIEEKGVNYV